jgi:hypothetical protein
MSGAVESDAVMKILREEFRYVVTDSLNSIPQASTSVAKTINFVLCL